MVSFTAQQIALLVQGKIEGAATAVVEQFGKIESAMPGEISFLANPKYEDFLYTTKASVIIVNESLVLKKKITATLIRVPDAYAAFATLLTKYQEMKNENLVGIQSPSFIASTAKLGEQNFVAAFAYIGENVKTGNNVKIFPSAVIGENVSIGNNVTIHAGVIIYSDCVLGNNITIHSGSIIGSDGFGFAPKADGSYQKIPQLGNVIIEDDVEIGASCTIDKGVSGDTILGKGTKLDNQIHIGHDTVIGKHCLFAAQVGIAGVTKIEDEVILWGQVGVSKDLTIGKGAIVLAQSGVPKSIEGGKTYYGTPVGEARSKMKEQAYIKRIPDMLETLRMNEKHSE
jgi:UDP-3-O-[3-hydroxymyristoyl] glucosamine N-acyltransferase